MIQSAGLGTEGLEAILGRVFEAGSFHLDFVLQSAITRQKRLAQLAWTTHERPLGVPTRASSPGTPNLLEPLVRLSKFSNGGYRYLVLPWRASAKLHFRGKSKTSESDRIHASGSNGSHPEIAESLAIWAHSCSC